jgi:hypothetical protein
MTLSDETPAPAETAWWQQIGEDWWSVLIGGALILLVALGVIQGVPW